MSLDGYIAGADGEFDWIVMDPDIDFAEMSDQFDTYLIGRRDVRGHEQPRAGGGARRTNVRVLANVTAERLRRCHNRR